MLIFALGPSYIRPFGKKRASFVSVELPILAPNIRHWIRDDSFTSERKIQRTCIRAEDREISQTECIRIASASKECKVALHDGGKGGIGRSREAVMIKGIACVLDMNCRWDTEDVIVRFVLVCLGQILVIALDERLGDGKLQSLQWCRIDILEYVGTCVGEGTDQVVVVGSITCQIGICEETALSWMISLYDLKSPYFQTIFDLPH